MELSQSTREQGEAYVRVFLDEISAEIGSPSRKIEPFTVSVHKDGPAMLLRNDGSATVYLGPNALLYSPTLIANLAHESVHLHEGSKGQASGLEEGYAVDFELRKVADKFGRMEREHFLSYLPASCRRVLCDYKFLTALYPDALTRIRKRHGRLTGPSFFDLLFTFPGLGVRRCYRLARIKQMR